MNTFSDLNRDNLIFFLTQYYDNPSCQNLNEFYNDLEYFKYTKRLIIKIYKGKQINLSILVNHLITIYNLFESSESNSKLQIATRILFLRIDEKYWSILKTFLVFINRCPEEEILSVEGKSINLESIPVNESILKELYENI